MTDSSTQATFTEARRFTVQMSAHQAEHWMYLASRGTYRTAEEANPIPADTVNAAPADPIAEGQKK